MKRLFEIEEEENLVNYEDIDIDSLKTADDFKRKYELDLSKIITKVEINTELENMNVSIVFSELIKNLEDIVKETIQEIVEVETNKTIEENDLDTEETYDVELPEQISVQV